MQRISEALFSMVTSTVKLVSKHVFVIKKPYNSQVMKD